MPENKLESATVQQIVEECKVPDESIVENKNNIGLVYGGIDVGKMSDGSIEKREYNRVAVRAMSETDIEAVALIEDASFTTPWTAQGFLDALQNPNAYCLVAEQQSEEQKPKVAGYCVIYHAADEGEISTIAVAPEFRGQGVADTMFAALKETVPKLGLATLYLDVRVSNTPARRLYEKQGFVEDGIRKRFYREPVEDAILMHYALTESED